LVTVPLEEGGVEIVAVLADRKKETVAAFLRAIPEPLRRTIERTCTDMYEGFANAITEEIPWAEIVIDRSTWRESTAMRRYGAEEGTQAAPASLAQGRVCQITGRCGVS